MRNAGLEEAQAGIKIAGRNINNLRYAEDTALIASLVAQRLKSLPAMTETSCNVGDLNLILALGRSPGEGNGNSLQYFCLENPMDRRAWWATVHGSQRVGHD